MANAFDQFDAVQAPQGGNPFDRFDASVAAPQSPDFWDRTSNDFKGRMQKEAAIDQNNDPWHAKALEYVGNALGAFVGDPVSNVAGSMARQLRDDITSPQAFITGSPSSSGQAIQQQTGDALRGAYKDSSASDVVNGMVSNYNQFTQNYPVVGRQLGAIGDIAAAIPALKSLSVPGAALSDIGEGLANSRRQSFVSDLVQPDLTPSQAVKAGEPLRTEKQGILGKYVTQPNGLDQASIDVVSQIPEVKPGNTYLENFHAINDVKNQEAQNLSDTLTTSGANYDRAGLDTKLSSVLDSLKEDPLVVGDAETTATRTVNKMQSLAAQNDNTPAGLLNARQEFDQWALSKKKGVFDNNQNAFTAAVRDTRQAVNQHIAETVPDAGVADSLSKQSSLYNALDNIAPKVANESPTSLGRLADKYLPDSKLGKAAVGAAAASGLTGAALTGMLPAAALGIGGVAAVKGANAALPNILKGAGSAMQGISDFLSPSQIAKLPPREASDVLNRIYSMRDRVNAVNGQPSIIPDQKLLTGPQALNALPAPEDVYKGDRTGNIVKSYDSNATSDSRQQMNNIGLTPDVMKVQRANQLNQLWEQRLAQPDKAAQLDQLAKESAPTLQDMVQQALQTESDRAAAVGERPQVTPLIDALDKALKQKGIK